jgi:hypothetical protein
LGQNWCCLERFHKQSEMLLNHFMSFIWVQWVMMQCQTSSWVAISVSPDHFLGCCWLKVQHSASKFRAKLMMFEEIPQAEWDAAEPFPIFHMSPMVSDDAMLMLNQLLSPHRCQSTPL